MRVVVADDAVILREGLARLLEEAGFEVVGLAADADELCALVERSSPDVAIVDIRMPPTHTDEGLRAAKLIRARWPQVGILVLSQYVQARYAVELLAQGTERVGYLLKDRVSDLDELSASVRRIGEGGSVLDPAVVAQLVGQRRKGDTPLEDLTERELEVLALMAEGRSNKAIAERLFITEHTVEKHVKNIFAHAALAAVGRRPPARARGRHVPQRGVVPASPTAKVSGCPAGQARSRGASRRAHAKEVADEHRTLEHPATRDVAVAAWIVFVVACLALGAISGTKTLDNGAVGESARGYAIMNKHRLWGPARELAYLHARARACTDASAIRDVERRFRALGLAPELKLSARPTLRRRRSWSSRGDIDGRADPRRSGRRRAARTRS